MKGSELFKISFTRKPLKCISLIHVNSLLKEVHSGNNGENKRGRKLYQKLLDLGYYWPSMEADTTHPIKKCYPSQVHGNAIHALVMELHSINIPWLFHTWVFELIGPFNPPSKWYIRILATTECFTKWLKAIPLNK